MATRDYSTDAITVHWDSSRCIHSAECLRRLPLVFDTGNRPWITVGAAPADDIAEAVRHCPSGALTYTRRDGVPLEADTRTPAELWVYPDGPLVLSGNITITASDGTVVEQGTRYTLCRCGGSGNKPFCDGTHKKIDFHG